MNSGIGINDAPRVENNMILFTDSELDMILKYMEMSEATTIQDAILTAVGIALDDMKLNKQNLLKAFADHDYPITYPDGSHGRGMGYGDFEKLINELA